MPSPTQHSSILDGILKDEASPLNRISELIQPGSKVLDIGAGRGILGEILSKKGKLCSLDAIEPGKCAKDIKGYCEIHQGSVEQHLNELDLSIYDFVVLADVVEHLIDPLPVLQSLALGIKSEAKILISLPNISFSSVRLGLLNGHFPYSDSGILDRTHLHFYTLASIKELINAIGHGIRSDLLFRLNRGPWDSEIPIAMIQTPYWVLRYIFKDPEALVYQYIVQLSKNQKAIAYEENFGHHRRPPFYYYWKLSRKLLKQHHNPN